MFTTKQIPFICHLFAPMFSNFFKSGSPADHEIHFQMWREVRFDLWWPWEVKSKMAASPAYSNTLNFWTK